MARKIYKNDFNLTPCYEILHKLETLIMVSNHCVKKILYTCNDIWQRAKFDHEGQKRTISSIMGSLIDCKNSITNIMSLIQEQGNIEISPMQIKIESLSDSEFDELVHDLQQCVAFIYKQSSYPSDFYRHVVELSKSAPQYVIEDMIQGTLLIDICPIHILREYMSARFGNEEVDYKNCVIDSNTTETYIINKSIIREFIRDVAAHHRTRDNTISVQNNDLDLDTEDKNVKHMQKILASSHKCSHIGTRRFALLKALYLKLCEYVSIAQEMYDGIMDIFPTTFVDFLISESSYTEKDITKISKWVKNVHNRDDVELYIRNCNILTLSTSCSIYNENMIKASCLLDKPDADYRYTTSLYFKSHDDNDAVLEIYVHDNVIEFQIRCLCGNAEHMCILYTINGRMYKGKFYVPYYKKCFSILNDTTPYIFSSEIQIITNKYLAQPLIFTYCPITNNRVSYRTVYVFDSISSLVEKYCRNMNSRIHTRYISIESDNLYQQRELYRISRNNSPENIALYEHMCKQLAPSDCATFLLYIFSINKKCKANNIRAYITLTEL